MVFGIYKAPACVPESAVAPTNVVSGTVDATGRCCGTTANFRDYLDKKNSNMLGWVDPRTLPMSTADSTATPSCVDPST